MHHLSEAGRNVSFVDVSKDNKKELFGTRSTLLKVRGFEGETKLLLAFREGQRNESEFDS